MPKTTKRNTSTVDYAESVMHRIESEHITMKPKWIFLVGTASVIFGIASFTLLSSFLLSFVWYFSAAIGYERLLVFGPQGWLYLAVRLPWVAIGASFLLMLIGWWMVQHSQVGYSHRKRVVGLSVLVAIISCSWVLHWSNIWQLVPDSMLPAQVQEKDQIYSGRIIRVYQNIVYVRRPSKEVVPMLLTGTTKLIDLNRRPIIGEYVVAIGEWQEDVFVVEYLHSWLKETDY